MPLEAFENASEKACDWERLGDARIKSGVQGSHVLGTSAGFMDNRLHFIGLITIPVAVLRLGRSACGIDVEGHRRRPPA